MNLLQRKRSLSIFLPACLLAGMTHITATQAQTPSKSAKIPNNASAFQAALTGDLAKLKRLLPSGADINKQDKEGKTLLHYAVLGGKTDVVRWLVARKIAINVKDANGATALTLARRSTDDGEMEQHLAEIIAFLQEHGAQESTSPSPASMSSAPSATVQQSVQKPASQSGASATATMASLLGKDRSDIEKVWGPSTTAKPRHIGVYDTVRGFEFVRVTYADGANGKQPIAEVWLVPEGEGKPWQDVLKLAGFKTNGVRLEGKTLKGVPGLPSYFHASWEPYGDGPKKGLCLSAVSG